ncbi:MAG: AAC(3) family N-acetyltransferase [Spirochaetota bacterium]
MHSKSSILEQIHSLGISHSDTVLIHSSLRAIGAVDGGADTLLDAFEEYLHDGLLVLPTHTWRQINADYNIFDPQTEPSCVGALTERFRLRSETVRSWHPTHSVAAAGGDAADFTAGEHRWDTPCPRGSCWGKLYDRDAKVLFVGCTLRSNTLLHGVEEWLEVPNRIANRYERLKIRTPDGSLLDRPMRRHETPYGDVSENYGRMHAPFFREGIARWGRIGYADTIVCDAAGMVELTSEYLRENPDFFAPAEEQAGA